MLTDILQGFGYGTHNGYGPEEGKLDKTVAVYDKQHIGRGVFVTCPVGEKNKIELNIWSL